MKRKRIKIWRWLNASGNRRGRPGKKNVNYPKDRKPPPLTPKAMKILSVIPEIPETITLKEIKKETGLKGNISNIIKRLVKRELIYRTGTRGYYSYYTKNS